MLRWLELGVPGLDSSLELLEEMHTPLLVVRMVYERNLLAVELLMTQRGTLLQIRDVNQHLR